MTYDRDAEILYLAHQLWEEDVAPAADSHRYWAKAALQVLARGPRPQPSKGVHMTSLFRATQVRLNARQSRNGRTSRTALRIEMGQAAGQQRITFITRNDNPQAANQTLLLARTAD